MKSIRKGLITGLMMLAGFQAFAGGYGGENFPEHPDPQMTPGSLCDRPDSRRYPEKIAYCSRDVEPQLKAEIIQEYNQRLGYRILTRGQYKIDHYIPLCMGGSNHPSNLWPQHQTIYQQTDPLEGLLCEKMRDGRLMQSDAVELIKKAKNNLEQVQEIIRYAEAL